MLETLTLGLKALLGLMGLGEFFSGWMAKRAAAKDQKLKDDAEASASTANILDAELKASDKAPRTPDETLSTLDKGEL